MIEKIQAALMTSEEAAKYLSISRSYFDEHVRPFLPVVDMRAPGSKSPMPRFSRADVDAYWNSRRNDKKAVSA